MRHYIRPEIRKRVIQRDGKCVYCSKPVAKVVGDDTTYNKRWKAYDESGAVFHFEHHIPQALGGVSDESNIVLACATCNLAKARKEAAAIADSKGEPMTHTIKVSEEVYNRLRVFQDKRESFSQTVGRLLTMMEKMGELRDILEGGEKFEAWKLHQLRKG